MMIFIMIFLHHTIPGVYLTSFSLGCNSQFLLFLKKIIYLIYLFLAALGLCCCVRAFSSYGEQGLLFVVVCGLLTVVASRCGAGALGLRALERSLGSCGARA